MNIITTVYSLLHDLSQKFLELWLKNLHLHVQSLPHTFSPFFSPSLTYFMKCTFFSSLLLLYSSILLLLSSLSTPPTLPPLDHQLSFHPPPPHLFVVSPSSVILPSCYNSLITASSTFSLLTISSIPLPPRYLFFIYFPLSLCIVALNALFLTYLPITQVLSFLSPSPFFPPFIPLPPHSPFSLPPSSCSLLPPPSFPSFSSATSSIPIPPYYLPPLLSRSFAPH